MTRMMGCLMKLSVISPQLFTFTGRQHSTIGKNKSGIPAYIFIAIKKETENSH